MTQTPAIPAYICRHAEFGSDPSTVRLREQAGIARASTSFGYDTLAFLAYRPGDA